MKRRIFDLSFSTVLDMWVIAERDGGGVQHAGDVKSAALARAREVAKAAEPSQLVVRGRNGRIQTEHTYPRSSDPVRSVG